MFFIELSLSTNSPNTFLKKFVFFNYSNVLKLVIIKIKKNVKIIIYLIVFGYYFKRFTSLVWVPFVPHLCVHNVQLAGTHLGGHGSIEHDCDFNGSKPGSQSSVGAGIESFF